MESALGVARQDLKTAGCMYLSGESKTKIFCKSSFIFRFYLIFTPDFTEFPQNYNSAPIFSSEFVSLNTKNYFGLPERSGRTTSQTAEI